MFLEVQYIIILAAKKTKYIYVFSSVGENCAVSGSDQVRSGFFVLRNSYAAFAALGNYPSQYEALSNKIFSIYLKLSSTVSFGCSISGSPHQPICFHIL